VLSQRLPHVAPICNKKKPKVIWEEPPRRPSCRQSHWLQWKVPNFHPPKTAHSLRRSPPKSNTPIQTPPNHHPNHVPLNDPTQPFCQDAECVPTDRQLAVRCGPLRRTAEPCGRLADHCGALGCMRCMCRTLRWSASHTKPPNFNNSGTLRKRYRKLRDACGPL